MVPITDHDRTNVDLVGIILGSINNHRTKKAASILGTVVGVIPGSSVEISLECVRESFTRGDWTLVNTRYTIIPWGCSLQDAMPMEASTFFRSGDLVMYRNLEGVAPICRNLRSWELIVDEKDALVDTIWCNKAAADGEVISSDHTCSGRLLIWICGGGTPIPPREALG